MGLDVPFYYSGLGTANDRELLLARFTGRAEPRAPVVICTSAFGMGLDVPDVRLVVHWQHPASVEDYLQEFGRAGRDNLPSVAVLFTDVKDVGLLRYMAEKTVEAANIDPAMVIETLDARLSAIGDMRRLAISRDGCFRDGIVEYFQGPRKESRNSLAVMLVDWLFSRSTTVRRSDGCCDYRDGVDAATVVGWATRGPWGSLALPSRRHAAPSEGSSQSRSAPAASRLGSQRRRGLRLGALSGAAGGHPERHAAGREGWGAWRRGS